MKHLPTGIQNIEEILNGNFVYIDKTDFAYRLITSGKHYFMSRPRRFGKSLFISTLEEIFKGNKGLFRGCSICDSDYDWKPHPILHLDFSRLPDDNPDKFSDALKRKLHNLASQHGVSIKTPSLQEGIEDLVVKISAKRKVVILVDEYDHPIINNLQEIKIADKNRNLLKALFGTLKSLDAYIKFTFVTGVSKFSQVSLFSGPNYLTDITMDEEYACMLGYTDYDVRKYFEEHTKQIVNKRKLAGIQTSEDNVLDELRVWYNGYRFSKQLDSVYNPFSTLNFMKSGNVEGYWYNTGTPSFLIDQVQNHPQSVASLSGSMAFKSSLMDISRLERIDLTALMFQTGYLTVQNYFPDSDMYCLDFPNREVREAFFNSLLEDFAQIKPTDISQSTARVQESLRSHQIQQFVEIINSHFAKISYQLFAKAHEGFYSAIFLTFLERSGIKTSAEVSTNIGRIDLAAELQDLIFVFEFKLDQSADIAFKQVDAKKYKERYSHTEKNILVIGINFSSKSRNISEWKAKLFSPEGKELKEL